MSLRVFTRHEPLLRWSFSTTKAALTGAVFALIGALLALLGVGLGSVPSFEVVPFIQASSRYLVIGGVGASAFGLLLMIGSLVAFCVAPDTWHLRMSARRTLFSYRFGNPLRFKDGEQLPKLTVTREGHAFWLEVEAVSTTPEEIVEAQNALSAGLRGRLRDFAVVATDAHPASNWVRFKFENVVRDRSIYVSSIDDLLTTDVTKLRVQKGLEIDLTSSGSILAVGVTRSGKTSGVISLLLQLATFGPDKYGSRIIIIDPKMAELSQISSAVTLDEEGSAKPVLHAMKEAEALMKRRQAALNEASATSGSPAKWWDLDMHPTVLFIDEFVALRTLFPSRASKDDGGYNLSEFEASLRRLITMGASAGVFVIISIAQASVENIPSMLRRAFSTRFLFRPTADEARLLWEGSSFESVPPMLYGPGDAWFSSEDGVHDNVTYAHFPVFSPDFGEYRVLGELLTAYEENRSLPPALGDYE